MCFLSEKEKMERMRSKSDESNLSFPSSNFGENLIQYGDDEREVLS